MSEVNDIYATARSADEAMDTLIAKSVPARNQQIKADAMRYFRAGNSPSESVRLAIAQENRAYSQQTVRQNSTHTRFAAIVPPLLGTVIPALFLLFLDSHFLIQRYFTPFTGEYTNFALMYYPLVLGLILGFIYKKNAIKGAFAGMGLIYLFWIGMPLFFSNYVNLTLHSVYVAVLYGWICWPSFLPAGIMVGKLGRKIWDKYVRHRDH